MPLKLGAAASVGGFLPSPMSCVWYNATIGVETTYVLDVGVSIMSVRIIKIHVLCLPRGEEDDSRRSSG